MKELEHQSFLTFAVFSYIFNVKELDVTIALPLEVSMDL